MPKHPGALHGDFGSSLGEMQPFKRDREAETNGQIGGGFRR
jgi:hypothetical protein